MIHGANSNSAICYHIFVQYMAQMITTMRNAASVIIPCYCAIPAWYISSWFYCSRPRHSHAKSRESILSRLLLIHSSLLGTTTGVKTPINCTCVTVDTAVVVGEVFMSYVYYLAYRQPCLREHCSVMQKQEEEIILMRGTFPFLPRTLSRENVFCATKKRSRAGERKETHTGGGRSMIIEITLEREDEWGLWQTFGPAAASPLCVL